MVSVRAEKEEKKVIGCSNSMYAYKNKSSYQEGRKELGEFYAPVEKKTAVTCCHFLKVEEKRRDKLILH
jgi:hypothetical protein